MAAQAGWSSRTFLALGFGRQVEATDEPLVVLFDQQAAGEADRRPAPVEAADVAERLAPPAVAAPVHRGNRFRSGVFADAQPPTRGRGFLFLRVFLEPTGIGEAATALSELRGLAVGTAVRIVIRDPAALARGTGWVYVDVPAAETPEDAVSMVQTLLDRARCGRSAFAIFQGARLS